MHRCLAIPELLIAIVGHAHGGQLLNIALTCRMFTDPALDALWSNLGDIRRIIQLLPWMLVSSTNPVHRVCISIQPPPSPAEWARFEWYARRVRFISLGIPHDHGYDVCESSYQALKDHFAPRPVFERLRQITVKMYPPWLGRYLLLLASPSLRRVQVNSQQPSEDDALLSFLVSSASTLQDLHLRQLRDNYVPNTRLPQALSKLSALTYLNLFIVEQTPDDTLTAIASLPRLTHLVLTITGSPKALLSNEVRGSFGNLQQLDIIANDIVIIRILRITFPTLTELKLVSSMTSTNIQYLVDLVDVVASYRDILGCYLDIRCPWPWHYSPAFPSFSILSPLLSIKHMKLLRLTGGMEGPLPINMTVADLRAMAVAWPSLRDLLIDVHPRPSLTDLSIFSSYSRNLESLDITVKHAPRDYLPGYLPRSENLRSLDIGRSDIEALGRDRAMALISWMFPNAALYFHLERRWAKDAILHQCLHERMEIVLEESRDIRMG